jgi:hypothetical protein
MNTSAFSSQTKFWRLSAGTALIATVLAGCGGGGGGGTPAMLSGAVIDGYISGATVCLDLNANQTCDPNEPKATSGEKGVYRLDITGIDIEVLKAAHLFTHIPDSATDSDDSEDGKTTLKDVSKAPFSMLAPVAAYVNSDNTLSKAVISPLTTLVSHDMLVNDKPLQGAQNAVRSRLGLSDTVDLSQDFVANKTSSPISAALHQQAQVIAAALGQVQNAIKAQDKQATSRDAFFAAMAYSQEKAKDLNGTLSGGGSVANQVAQKMEEPSFSPNPATLLSEARQSTQSTPATSATQVLSEGVYLADLLQDNPPQFTKALVKNGEISVTGFELRTNQWFALEEDGDPEYVLTANGWKEDNGCAGGKIKDTSAGKAELTCPDNSKATVSVRTLDIQEKSLADLGQNAPENLKNVTFPEGSQLHQTVFTNLTDEYQIWAGANWGADIASFMRQYPTGDGPNPPIQRFYSADAVISFTFDTPAEGAKSGTVSLWKLCQSTAASCITSGKADYQIKTVQGQELLIVKIKPVYEAHGNFLLFAAKDRQVHSGVFRPAVTGSVTDFFLNKTAMNAVLNAANLRTID